MANIQALADLERWLNALKTVRNVREFMVPGPPGYKIGLEVPGAPLPGHQEYHAMLEEEFHSMLPELDAKIKQRLRQRETDAKDQIALAAGRL